MKYHSPTPGQPYKSATGRVYQIAEYHALGRKDPGSLTDEDLGIIESFGGTVEADRLAAARARVTAPASTPTPARASAAVVMNDAAMSLAESTELILKVLDQADPHFDREQFTAKARAARERLATVGTYDGLAFIVALKQYHAHPNGLTDADLTALSIVDRDLGDAARAARAGFEKAVDRDRDHALARLPVSALGMFRYVASVQESINIFAKTVARLSREAHARLDAVEHFLAAPKEPLGTDAAIIKALMIRVTVLEQRPALIYRGVFDPSKAYEPGNLCTWSGSLWHANDRTSAKPGEASAASRAWQLCAKKGADGRDGKDAK